MVDACPNCQRGLRPGMNFCPGCGTPLDGGQGQETYPGAGPARAPVPGRDGTIHFHVPAQGPYPMPYLGGPMMYRPPMTGRRATAIASAVIMLISAAFVLIAGIVYTVEGLWWEDFWVVLGVMCFASFSMAVVATVAIARRTWRFAPLVADGMLIACGVFSIIDLDLLGLIILVLAIIALILFAVSWGQFKERFAFPYAGPYGGPYGGPAMMAPPGPGMPGPPAVTGPSPGMGAPPPGYAPPGPVGAPPPRAVPVEEGVPPPDAPPGAG